MITPYHTVLALCIGIASPVYAQATKSCVEVDTTLEWSQWPNPETSPPRADVDAFERRLKTAPPTSIPAVLLSLGRLNTRLVVDSAYAAARPDEFFFQELAGTWLYTGWHFAELLRRFPASHFADDAAYAQTLVPVGGECEGYVPCQVAWLWMRLAPFLRGYPESPYADSAVQRTLLAFSPIKKEMDLVRGSQDVDTPEIRKLVDSLEVVANTLPAPHRATLLVRVAEVREQMGMLREARITYRVAAGLGAGRASACAVRHVTRLEARLARP